MWQGPTLSEPIPGEKMVAEDKLTAEGGLSEPKIILGWLFSFRTLTAGAGNDDHTDGRHEGGHASFFDRAGGLI